MTHCCHFDILPPRERCQPRGEDLPLRELIHLFFSSHQTRTRALLKVAMKLDLALHGESYAPIDLG